MSYHAVFHDFPDCLETHVYAPLGLDIRGKWSIGGSLPGEPKERPEPGLKVPHSGLYIREEVKMTCSKLLMGFVKKTFKDSHSQLVEKLVERAHILESNAANERLQALRNVEPRERMGHGDIFIAPPPDYQFDKFGPPAYKPQPSPRFATHSRSQSASPILTPGLSQSSSVTERSASVSSLPAQSDRPSSSHSLLSPKAASVPEKSLYLLPATTYNGGSSSSFNRPISLYPGSTSDPASNRLVSVIYDTTVDEEPSDDDSDDELIPASSHIVSPPSIPEVRPISFNLVFGQRSPGPKTPISHEDLLADIDAAIDESYIYCSPDTPYEALPSPNALQAAGTLDTLPATTYETLPSTTYLTLPSTTYQAPLASSFDTLPSTTYRPEPAQTLDTLPSMTYTPQIILTSAAYSPKRERKDSVMPYNEYSDLPPTPLPKDEKYLMPRKQSVTAF